MKKYLIFLDILGFEELPKELAKKSGFQEDFIRETCLSIPLKRVIGDLKNEQGFWVKEGTDNYVVLADTVQLVFKVIDKVTGISIPHRDYASQYFPLEIAIDAPDISDQEGITEYVNRSEIITSLKKGILTAYKLYYKRHKLKNVTQTFVIYTIEFHSELEKQGNDRHTFSEKIAFDNRLFYQGDLDLFRDTSGIISSNRINVEKFKRKIDHLQLWRYYETKAFLFRTYDQDKWITQFLFIRLLDERPIAFRSRDTEHLNLIHTVDEIDGLHKVFLQLTEGKCIDINDIAASLELLTGQIKYENSYLSSLSLSKSYGINNYCYVLLKGGTNSTLLSGIERRLLAELAGRFDYLRDAVMNNLHLPFQWSLSYGPFVVVLAPVQVNIVDASVRNGQISITMNCSELIDLDGLRARLYGWDKGGQQAGSPQEVEDFRRRGRRVSLLSDIHLSDLAISIILRLYYYGDMIAERKIL